MRLWISVSVPYQIESLFQFSRSHSHSRFVTKDDITEYIDPDNLLERFGGNDPWQYDFEEEKARIKREVPMP